MPTVEELQTRIAELERDITEHKQTKATMQQMILAMEQAVDGIAIADIDGNMTFVNSAWAQMHGYSSADELVGKNLSMFHTEEQIQQEVVPFNNQVMEKGSHQGEMGHRRKDGTTFPTWMAIALLTDEDGNPAGLAGTMRDITEQKRVEEDRARFQQNLIDAQQAALRELSTPIIPIMEGIIIMPLIGTIDSNRALAITRALLAGISTYRAQAVILDVTGVPIIDSGVADHLNKTIQAARLKGAQAIITGISSEIAEAIVDLGINWQEVDTLRDLRTGLVAALARLKKQIVDM